MLMRFRLLMLMMFTLPVYSIFFAEVGYYDSIPSQPLDPWRGHLLMRRLGERMMRF